MQIPKIEFNLNKDTGISGIELFQKLALDLKKFGKGSDNISKWFAERCKQIVQAVITGEKITRILHSARDIRVLIHLWITDDTFFLLQPIQKEVITHIQDLKTTLTPSLIEGFIRVFFEKYDHVLDLEYLCSFIKNALSLIQHKKSFTKEIKAYSEFKDILFQSTPQKCIEFAQKNAIPFSDLLIKLHIPNFPGYAYVQELKYHYYIAPINKLKIGESHELFQEIIRSEIKEIEYKDALNIGQAVAVLMIDKLEFYNDNIPDSWLNFLRSILGDPRIPKNSPQYRKWWSPLKPKYEQIMRKWLAQIDLIVFLEVLEEVGRRTDNQKIQRMFPERKRFLESLYKTGLIKDTRLFLGVEPTKYVTRRFKDVECPMFSSLLHKNKSVIYLNISGIHFFEGTHNFSVRIYKNLPPSLSIWNMEKDKFSTREISTDLDQIFSNTEQSNESYVISHDIHGAWKKKLLTAFQEMGVLLNN